jgi:hypothetical protein
MSDISPSLRLKFIQAGNASTGFSLNLVNVKIMNTFLDLELMKVPARVAIYANADSRTVYLDHVQLHAAYSQQIRNHSPTGFSWGYNGSGCAQLALAILLHYLSVGTAVDLYQKFKERYVATWDIDKNVQLELNLRLIIQELIAEQEKAYNI